MAADDMLEQIISIGRGLMQCRVGCAGIALDPAEGVLPRALVLELGDQPQDAGVVILGINPGNANDEEKAEALRHGGMYDSWLRFWESTSKERHPYHVRLRRLVRSLGISGPILWTDLVKCENPVRVKRVPPVETVRTCVHRFLMNEMDVIRDEWPVIAIG
jgi:hypothetical protein